MDSYSIMMLHNNQSSSTEALQENFVVKILAPIPNCKKEKSYELKKLALFIDSIYLAAYSVVVL